MSEISWRRNVTLKRRYDGDILVAGSATLVRSLAEHNLVDEYRLMVHPQLLGRKVWVAARTSQWEAPVLFE
jgi:dihydrofolate reductase